MSENTGKETVAERAEKLAQRLALKEQAPQTQQTTDLLNPHQTNECVTHCKVCGVARLDPDPTGLTCGQPACLIGLGKLFLEMEENPTLSAEIDSMLEELDIDPDSLPNDVVSRGKTVLTEIKKITSALEKIEETEANQ